MRRRPRRRLVALLAVAALAACSGGGGDDGSPEAKEPTPATAPPVPAPSAPGTGTVVIGAASSPFEVTACMLEPDEREPAGARTLFAAQGEGTTRAGVAFTVEARRFVTGIEVETFTDTISYTDSARILQAQRIEVKGLVTDLRDEHATTPLLRLRDDGASASGLAGAPGELAADEGVIGLALDLTCTAP